MSSSHTRYSTTEITGGSFDIDNDFFGDVSDFETYTTDSTTGNSIQVDDSYKLDGSISISTGSNTTINPNTISGQFPNEEKLQEIAEMQLEKLEELQEVLIDYLADNDIDTAEKMRWKSDFDKIQEYRDQLPNVNVSIPYVTENSILDPSDLEQLNDIYKRWS